MRLLKRGGVCFQGSSQEVGKLTDNYSDTGPGKNLWRRKRIY